MSYGMCLNWVWQGQSWQFAENYNYSYFKKLAHRHYYSTTSQATCRVIDWLSGWGRGEAGCQFRALVRREICNIYTLTYSVHTLISFRCRMAAVMTLIKANKISTHGHFFSRTSSVIPFARMLHNLHDKRSVERSRALRRGGSDRQLRSNANCGRQSASVGDVICILLLINFATGKRTRF